MTAGVCVPQRVSECVSCVHDVNECYCAEGKRHLCPEVVTIPTESAPAFTSAPTRHHQQEITRLMQLVSKILRKVTWPSSYCVYWRLRTCGFYRQSPIFLNKFNSDRFAEEDYGHTQLIWWHSYICWLFEAGFRKVEEEEHRGLLHAQIKHNNLLSIIYVIITYSFSVVFLIIMKVSMLK